MGINKYVALTMVELLVVLTIISVVSAVAFPSYQQYLVESRRYDAINALRGYQIEVENYISINGTTPGSVSITNPTPNGFYNIVYNQVDSARYTLTATAVVTKSQNSDTDCNPLIISSEADEVMPFNCR